MTFQVDPMAAQFRRNQGRQFEAATPPVAIETDRINALGQFQIMVSLGGTIAGVLVAQTVFMVHEQHSTRE
ncbi:hypothetical protein [Nodosilinea sp. PGN35]|uniref:hypothetical protein n=1 Tax=Nodosilinea sp. PGN35 TaxID=3020489 RepID=UPI00398B483E